MIYLVSVLILAQVHLFFSGDIHWFIFAQEHHLIELMLTFLLFTRISYREIELKLVTLALSLYFLCVFIHSFYYYFYATYPVYLFWSIISSTVTCFFFLVIKNINIEYKESKVLDENYVYLLYRKPFSFLGMLYAVVFDPYGSVAIYCKGNVYGYRYGFPFRRLSKDRTSKYLKECLYIKTEISSEEGQKIINSLNNTKWTLRKNCFWIASHFK